MISFNNISIGSGAGLTITPPPTPPTVEYLVVSGGYRIYTFTSSGSITL